MLCLRQCLGLATPRDYHLPTTVLVQPLAISIERTAVVLSAVCEQNQPPHEWLLLCPTDCNCTHAFDAALQSITNFVHAEQSMLIRYVQNRNRDCSVIIDVQKYTDASSDSNDGSESSASDDIRRALLTCQRAMSAPSHCYFMFTVEQGAVLWIAALRSGEHGNRFPVDERTRAVIRFATLERYLRHSLTM